MKDCFIALDIANPERAKGGRLAAFELSMLYPEFP